MSNLDRALTGGFSGKQGRSGGEVGRPRSRYEILSWAMLQDQFLFSIQ